MATIQSLTSHNLTVDRDEDHMEMATSPYPHLGDNDIDFDLDDQREHSRDDNSMIDDTAETIDANLNQDDMMFYEDDNDLIDFDHDLSMDPDDSSYPHNQDIQEEEEEEEEFVPHLEASDQSFRDASFEDATIVADETDSRDIGSGHDDLQEEATNIHSTITEDSLTTNTNQATETEAKKEYEHNTNQPSLNQEADVDSSRADTQSTDVKDFAAEATSMMTSIQDPEQAEDDGHLDRVQSSVEPTGLLEGAAYVDREIETLAAELDESEQVQYDEGNTAAVGRGTQQSPQRGVTPVNLHPVSIRYNGEDCWLFPPFESNETRHVFLNDATLASQPFDRLLAALRSGLINDQEMVEHDELVFDIPVLGLHICEDSKHASLTSLSRVIDIYMMLSQNEGLTVFEPLYCELTTRVCLADQFAYVDDAAFVRRITYTDFVAEQADSPEVIAQDDGLAAQEAEEEVHADVSTYFDAANDHDEEVDHPNALADIQSTDDMNGHDDTALDPQSEPQPQPQSQSDVSIVEEGQEDANFDVDDAGIVAPSSMVKSESKVALIADEVVDPQQDVQDQEHDYNEVSLVDEQKSTNEASSNTSVQHEAEADEDLFADDVNEVNTPDIRDEESAEVPELQSNGTSSINATKNDDEFDFDNWSDDEQEKTKTDDIPALPVTPSKSVNGKRKLIDEYDDFLDIDVSTPEPKRTRQS